MPTISNRDPWTVGFLVDGRYEIESEVGSGAFGEVYAAKQMSTGQRVAVKVIRRGSEARSAPSAARLGRFRREIHLLGALSHPNIVRLIDAGETPAGELFGVYELVPGETLRGLLDREGHLAPFEAAHLMGQVLDALACAHAAGIVHRDLKPENILINSTGVQRNAIVLDFGLGGLLEDRDDEATNPRLTATRELIGTPSYAAPEQLCGAPVSTRSDIYAWGLVLLECLTGEMAVWAESGLDAVVRQIDPAPIVIPEWLRDHPLGLVIEAATRKDVERRDAPLEALFARLLREGAAHGGFGSERDAAAEPARLSGPLSAPSPSSNEGERRQITTVCCRFTFAPTDGSPAEIDRIDLLLRAHVAIAESAAARRGGRLVTMVGDRAWFAFGLVRTRENDACRACLVALDIVEALQGSGSPAPVRVGVHTGLVVLRADASARRGQHELLLGPTPQRGEWLAERAGDGQILLSEATRAALRVHLATEDLPDLVYTDEFGEKCVARRLTLSQRTRAALADATPTSSPLDTPLFGREAPLARLTEAWGRVQNGGSEALLIAGEAGIGKSRLLAELRAHVASGSWLEGRCLADRIDSPLRPAIELLRPLAKPLNEFLAANELDVRSAMPFFADLLDAPERTAFPLPPLMPDRRRDIVLDLLVALFVGFARRRPIVFVLEDLHWADPSTLDLVRFMVDEMARARGAAEPPRLLLLVTARPDLEPPWRAGELEVLTLPRLTPTAAAELAGLRLPRDGAARDETIAEIVRRSDGVPLFIEELARAAGEGRAVIGAETAGQPFSGGGDASDLPSSLRDILSARLDALAADARETAQLAAALGREFPFEVLLTVCERPQTALRHALDELRAADLLHRMRGGNEERYSFRHALLRDAAYDSMLSDQRRAVHKRIASVLQERFAETDKRQPEIVARHLEASGDLQAATAKWARAGTVALRRGAFIEGARHLRRSLSLFAAAPRDALRPDFERRTTEELGVALVATEGYAASSVEETFGRVVELYEERGDEPPLAALFSLWGVAFMRGDEPRTRSLVSRLSSYAERTKDPAAEWTAIACAGSVDFYAGELRTARERLERAASFFGSADLRSRAQAAAYDGSLIALGYQAWDLMFLGDLDRAQAIGEEMLRLGEESGNPVALGVAFAYGAAFARELDDPERALDLAERCARVSRDKTLSFWAAMASTIRGWARARCGDPQGRTDILEAIRQIDEMKGWIYSPNAYLLLAEACLVAGDLDAGLAAVESGLQLCQRLFCKVFVGELHRVRGELLLAGGREGAIDALRTALESARRIEARFLELRAARCLARALEATGDADAARCVMTDARGRIGPELGAAMQERASRGLDENPAGVGTLDVHQ